MGGYKASKLQSYIATLQGGYIATATIPAYKLLSYKEPNIMNEAMPPAEFLFFYSLNIFALSVSVTRDEYAGMSNVFVHGKLVTRCTSQRHAVEIAIIKFNEAPQAPEGI